MIGPWKQLRPSTAQGDISAEKMIWGIEGVDPERRAMLIEMLDIDLSWCAAACWRFLLLFAAVI